MVGVSVPHELHNRGIKTGFDIPIMEITIHELEKPIYLEVQKDLKPTRTICLTSLWIQVWYLQEQADN